MSISRVLTIDIDCPWCTAKAGEKCWGNPSDGEEITRVDEIHVARFIESKVDDNGDGYVLNMPFLDGSERFAFGFEIGRLFAFLQADTRESYEEHIVHSACIPQFELIATRFKRELRISVSSSENWVTIQFLPMKPKLTIVRPEDGTKL